MTKLLISSMYIESSSFFICPVISESYADLIIGLDVSEFLQLAVYNVWRGMELKMKTSMARFDQQNCNNNKNAHQIKVPSLTSIIFSHKSPLYEKHTWKMENSEACEKTMSIATRNSITYDRAWHTWQNMAEHDILLTRLSTPFGTFESALQSLRPYVTDRFTTLSAKDVT